VRNDSARNDSARNDSARNNSGAWTAIVVEPCLSWLDEVRRADRGTLIQIGQAVTALAEKGPGLSRPLVVTVPGSSLPNLRELRPGARGSTEVRLLFIVDPYRHAVFLAAGDKPGERPDRREPVVRQAEEAYRDYLSSARTTTSQPPRDGPVVAPRDGPVVAPRDGPAAVPRSGPVVAPRGGPAARSWDDLAVDFGFTAAERRQIRTGADQLIAEVRVRRVVEIRKRQHVSQAEVAAVLGVSQATVARIEKGQLGRGDVEPLAGYVKALGGKLKIVADFGDESYVLG
jgi:DNA-binding XRE family transcriptional regulator